VLKALKGKQGGPGNNITSASFSSNFAITPFVASSFMDHNDVYTKCWIVDTVVSDLMVFTTEALLQQKTT